jgi:hypothetical protein
MEDTNLLVYGTGSTAHRLLSASGQQQGDTLGSFLFALGIHPALEMVRERSGGRVLVRAICDDVHLVGSDADVAAAFTLLRDELAKQSLTLKYGPDKTCCWSPTFPRRAGETEEAAAARRATASAIDPRVVRLGEGMHTLGTFIGTDDYVRQRALELVCDTAVDEQGTPAPNPKSIACSCRELEELADGDAKNSRDIAGHQLRVCVVPKAQYLARTIEPRLLAPAAKAADDLITRAFCRIYGIRQEIFAPDASPSDKFTAARVRAPAAHKGCAIRSTVATSEAAYLASWRAVAPLICASGVPETRDALERLGDGAGGKPPLLATLVRLAGQFSTVLPDGEAKELMALERFTIDLQSGVDQKERCKLQHELAHAAERAEFEERRDEAELTAAQCAHLNSCSPRWLTHARMRWMQLSDEEVVTRMQRYLRQPLTILEGMAGQNSLGRCPTTGKPIAIDAYGDCFLSGYCAIDDNEWNIFHNACRDTVADCGRRGGAHIQTEKGRSTAAGSKRRLADILVRGSHKYKPAEGKEIYCDWVCTSALCSSIVAKAAKETGAAAQAAANRKHSDAEGHVPSHAYFLALPSEADGFVSPCVEALLHGFAQTRADRDHADICAMRAWHQHNMDALAHTHARGLTRVLIHRAQANLRCQSIGRRGKLLEMHQSDAEASRPYVQVGLPAARRPRGKPRHV